MDFPELLFVLLAQDHTAELPAVEARLKTLAEANGSNLALQMYLSYFAKTKTTPNVEQLKSHACCYPKSGPEAIEYDLELADQFKLECPPNNLPLAMERAWDDANQGYVLFGYKEAAKIAGINKANPRGYDYRKYEKRMNDLYGSESLWDRSAFSQVWLAEYFDANPFQTVDDVEATLETEHEFELAKAIGLEDDKLVKLSLTAIKATDIRPEALRWLWPDRIPYGKICWFAGKPDCGKSLALLDLIARVTTGSDWPDRIKNTWGPREVLIAISEDGLGDTVIPRLMAAGADLNNIGFIQRVIVKSGTDILWHRR